jgi:microcystin-dependent protein
VSKLLDLWGDMTGVVLDYALSTPPSSAWLMCYGQALTAGDPLTARLRQKLIDDSFPWGQDGSGNPRVPDARGRVFAGKDDMGGTAANRLTTAGAGINGTQLGAVGGAQTHTLTTAQLAAHNHGVNDPGHGHGVSDPGHGHSSSQDGHSHTLDGLAYDRSASGYGLQSGSSSYAGRVALYPSGSSTNTGTTSGASANAVYIGGAATGVSVNGAATGISTQNNGSGSAHNNTQPTAVMNKIIKL